MAFLVAPESVLVEERFAAGGAHQPHPRCTLHTCAQMVAWEVDGPSLQPLTWHWYTHLMPPSWIQRGCILAGMVSSKAGGTAGETAVIAWSVGSGTSGPVDSWGADGRWWQMGCGGLSYEEVGLGIWRNVTLLPSEAHRNPPPLNLPLLLPSSPIPQPPSAVPPSPICGPLPVGNQPFSVDLAPERRKYRCRNVKR